MKARFPALACAAAFLTCLTACGGGGGGSSVPSDPGGGGGGGPTPTPIATSQPSSSPGSTPTPQPSGLPVLYDTNPATSGIYIGDSCVFGDDWLCANSYAGKYRHSLSMLNAFTHWTTNGLPGCNGGGVYNDIGQFIAQGTENFTQIVAQNTTPMLTWQPDKVQYSDVINGCYDQYFTNTAKELAAFHSTIFIRPFHEFNGDYSTWSLAQQNIPCVQTLNPVCPQVDSEFIAAWQHMVTIFRNNGASNVKWVWCYANYSFPSDTKYPWNDPANAYPGDQYVDWIAFDAFNRGSGLPSPPPPPWLTFDQLIQASYQKAASIQNPGGGLSVRPVMVAELASNEWNAMADGGAKKGAWFTQMFGELASNSNPYPRLRALIYYDYSTIFPRNQESLYFALESSPGSANAWIAGIRPVNASGVLDFRGSGSAMNQL